jgi:hypothetical protein
MDNPQPSSPTPSSPTSEVSAGEFGAAFKGFLERTVAAAPVAEPVFAARLRAHFGADPAALPIIAEQFEPSDRPNLQAALDAWLRPSERSFEAVGVTSEYKRFNGLGLADILTPGRAGLVGGSGPAVGPVEYINVALDQGRVMTCLQFGLLLIRDQELPLAVLVSGPTERTVRDKGQVEVMAADRDQARAFLADLRAGMHERNVYRGHVVSLTLERYGSMQIKFHALPTIARENIVLADGVLERVERHTVGFAAHRDRLAVDGHPGGRRPHRRGTRPPAARLHPAAVRAAE